MGDESILLTISLLASNRRESTARCLDSLTPIREAVSSELIIVDTGCAPELRRELEARAELVVDFVWCNDFAKARNAGLTHAKGQWFLYLDDDEWFVESDEIIRFFQSGEYQEYGSADYIQRNFLDLEGSQWTDAWVGRMIRLEEDTRFVSRIHERLCPVRGRCKALSAIVHHFGYVYPDEAAKRKHFERNRTLLEEMLAEEPDEIRWKLQLLLEYRGMDEFETLRRLGKTYLAEMDGKASFEDRIYVGSFYAAEILAELGEANTSGLLGPGGARGDAAESALTHYAAAEQLCAEARKDPRNTEWFTVFLDFSEARSLFFLGEYRRAEAAARDYLDHMKAILEHADEDGILFEQRKAPFVGEALDEVKQKEIYSILICAGLKRQDLSALQEYLPRLHWEEQHVYVFEKIAECLIEAMCAGEDRMRADRQRVRNESPVERQPAEQNFDGQQTGEEAGRWHACMEEPSGQLPVFKTWRSCMEHTLQTLHGNSALWNYFCEEVMRWEREGNDISQIIPMMQTVAPEMFEEEASTDLMQGGAEESGTAGEAEFAELAAQIKAQIRQLIDNGLPEQALTVVRQLRTMLPEDEELRELENRLARENK